MTAARDSKFEGGAEVRPDARANEKPVPALDAVGRCEVDPVRVTSDGQELHPGDAGYEYASPRHTPLPGETYGMTPNPGQGVEKDRSAAERPCCGYDVCPNHGTQSALTYLPKPATRRWWHRVLGR